MTVTEARTAIQEVVEAHATHNTFYSIWQIEWPIKNPAGPFCPECGGLIHVIHPTTNDEQPKREPMLSAEALHIIGLKASEMKYGPLEQCMAIVGAISCAYESLIDKGVLAVVRSARLVKGKYGGVDCSACGRNYPNTGADPDSIDVGEFCRCGAKIIEP